MQCFFWVQTTPTSVCFVVVLPANESHARCCSEHVLERSFVSPTRNKRRRQRSVHAGAAHDHEYNPKATGEPSVNTFVLQWALSDLKTLGFDFAFWSRFYQSRECKPKKEVSIQSMTKGRRCLWLSRSNHTDSWRSSCTWSRTYG